MGDGRVDHSYVCYEPDIFYEQESAQCSEAGVYYEYYRCRHDFCVDHRRDRPLRGLCYGALRDAGGISGGRG